MGRYSPFLRQDSVWNSVADIELRSIHPGKPDQIDKSAFIERFNKTYREELLSAYVFESLEQVREITACWLLEYNQERPHKSLGSVPPLMSLPRKKDPESDLELCI